MVREKEREMNEPQQRLLLFEEAFLNIVPCVNNCGVTGNPATNNLCQKCFNAVSTSVFASMSTIPHKFSDKSPRSIVRMSSPETTYSNRHDCSYDYKAAGREATARENPMKAAKIIKL
ncbi:PREDICTED: zinc finger A20 and AN1 domain-containing stress-associated protein 5-like [Ipomoea nil]|uniref:zinc finger A20 and AN1 domain-containing stress-associated protein 5-like n=1 Tax=Ipomoea nil TaxID=35883 RepID=UPI00090161E1|nr:PREDICTED: zinc finger A20 and AN1 domain-containing stress-associated protein 5-like [Ipomoea nil]